jgi:glutamyl-tRNA synthetase
MSSIYANNRDMIDEETDRAFFVRDDADNGGGAVERQIVGGPDEGHPPVHPNHEDRGERTLSVENGVIVESEDLPQHGERVWLKGYGCVQHTRDALQYTGDDIEVVREGEVDVIHWVPAENSLETRLRTMDGDVDGYAEPGLDEYEADDLVQFERIGFARIDAFGWATGDDEFDLVAYYTHP